MTRLRDIIISAEETGRTIAEKLKVEVKEKHRTTFEERHSDLKVNGSYLLLEESGSGVIQEFVLWAPNRNFSVRIDRDGNVGATKSYVDLAEESPYVSDVDAFQDDSNYVIHLKSVEFRENVKIIVHGNLTLTRTYVKYSLSR